MDMKQVEDSNNLECGRICEMCGCFLSIRLYRSHQVNGCKRNNKVHIPPSNGVRCPICENRRFLDQRMMVDHFHATHGYAIVQKINLPDTESLLNLLEFMKEESGIPLATEKSKYNRVFYACSMTRNTNVDIKSCTAFLEATTHANGTVDVEFCNVHTHSSLKNVGIYTKQTRDIIAQMMVNKSSSKEIATAIRAFVAGKQPSERTPEQMAMSKITPYQVEYCIYLMKEAERKAAENSESVRCNNDVNSDAKHGNQKASSSVELESADMKPEPIYIKPEIVDVADSCAIDQPTQSVERNNEERMTEEHNEKIAVQPKEQKSCRICSNVPHEWIEFFDNLKALKSVPLPNEIKKTVANIKKFMDQTMMHMKTANTQYGLHLSDSAPKTSRLPTLGSGRKRKSGMFASTKFRRTFSRPLNTWVL